MKFTNIDFFLIIYTFLHSICKKRSLFKIGMANSVKDITIYIAFYNV